jgi:hydrophobe/amphiphile efflux-1 (HAE1) family protein
VNISGPFVRRPVATTLLAIGVLLLGIMAYSNLPIAAVPNVERPVISVSGVLPGASPETVASALIAPLERQLGLISGVTEMSSFSGAGGGTITIEFSLDKDIDAAAAAVQAAIVAASPSLPPDLPQPPRYWKGNSGGPSIMAIALTSETLDPSMIYDYADTIIAAKLSEIPGVAGVSIGGAEHKGVRIRVNPRRIANMNLSLDAVRIAAQLATTNLPMGEIPHGDQSFAIGSNSQLLTAKDYDDVVVAIRGTTAVRLGDVATISDSVIDDKVAGWFGGQDAVVIWVWKQPDANVVDTCDRIMALLPQIDHWIPAAIMVHVLYDRTMLIRAAIADVQLTVGIAMLLVVLVMALFLRRFWATLIPSVTIPVSIAATLVVMFFSGFSLDNLSLMAVTIAVGFVIDDAVIIIENVIRLMQLGETAIDAALKGARQMGFTVVSITAALIAALIPVLFWPDIVGRIFREFGLTLVSAMVVSAIVSLTLTPMMCAHLLPLSSNRPKGRFGHLCDRALAAVIAGYGRSLDRALRWRALVLTGTAAVTAATIGLYFELPHGFIPTQDTGILYVRTIAPPSISFAAMAEVQRAAAAQIQADPAVSGLVSFIGSGLGRTLSIGTMLVALKPPALRNEAIEDVIARLRPKLARVDGVRTFPVPVQDIVVGAQGSTSRYQYTITASDPDTALRWGRAMYLRLFPLPQLTDLIPDFETSGLEAGLTINRALAARLGVTPRAVDNALYDAFGQDEIKTMYLPHDYSRLIVEVDPQFQDDPTRLNDIFLAGVGRTAVPLAAVAESWRAHGTVWSHHEDQYPSVTISFNTPPGVSIGDAMAAIGRAQAAAHLPADVFAGFRGAAREAGKASRELPWLLLAAIMAVYIILGMLYESYAHPLTILSTLPSAAFGALLALAATGSAFTIITIIGCILLIGMVMKNAIMMVDFALAAERQIGMAPELAIREAARLRFRPIVMTTLAAVFGVLPLALGRGPGFEFRVPLGIAIVGGLIISQILTLYTTPAVYLAIDALRFKRRNATHAAGALSPVR